MHFINSRHFTAWLKRLRFIHPLGKNDSNCSKITTPTVLSKHFWRKIIFYTRILPLESYCFSHYFNFKLGAKLSHFRKPSHKMFHLNSSQASQGNFGGVLYFQRSLDTSQTSVKRHQLNQHINKSLRKK